MGKRSRNAHIPSMSDEELEVRLRELHAELHRREQSLRALKAEVGDIYGNSEVRSAKTLVFRAEYMISEVETEKKRRAERKAEADAVEQERIREQHEAEAVAAQARATALGRRLPDIQVPPNQPEAGPQLLYLTRPGADMSGETDPSSSSSSQAPSAEAVEAFKKAFEEGLSRQAVAAGYNAQLLTASQSLLTQSLLTGAVGANTAAPLAQESPLPMPALGASMAASALQAAFGSTAPAAPGRVATLSTVAPASVPAAAAPKGPRTALPVPSAGAGLSSLLNASATGGASVPAAFRRQPAMPAPTAPQGGAIPAAFLKKPQDTATPAAGPTMVNFK